MNLIIYSRRRGDARQIGLLRPGPVLAVMKAEDLDHAMKLVNQTGYGLT